MKVIDSILTDLKDFLNEKTSLEIAMGTGDFSKAASKYSKYITGIDLYLDKFYKNTQCILDNISVLNMDAGNISFSNSSFDTIIIYNSLCHIETILDKVCSEVGRVLKENGFFIIICTWKMERKLLQILEKSIAIPEGLVLDKIIKKSRYDALIYKKIINNILS